jgi:hypothetical protein
LKKFTVPLAGLNVPPVVLKLLVTCNVPVVELNVPPDNVNGPLMVILLLLAVKVPEPWEKPVPAVVIANPALMLIVPT